MQTQVQLWGLTRAVAKESDPVFAQLQTLTQILA